MQLFKSEDFAAETFLLKTKKNLISTFRCQPVAPLSSYVIETLTWNVQWWTTFNRSWDTGTSGCRCHNYPDRAHGSKSSTEFDSAPFVVYLHRLHSCYLLHLQLPLLINLSAIKSLVHSFGASLSFAFVPSS